MSAAPVYQRLGELHAMVAARLAAEDAARSEWLDRHLEKRAKYYSRICSRGHAMKLCNDGKYRCRVCNAKRMRAKRAQRAQGGGQKGPQ